MIKMLYIGGKWIHAKNYTELRSPYNGEIIAEVPAATEEEVELAIQAA